MVLLNHLVGLLLSLLLRSLHIVFRSGCPSLHSNQQRVRIPFSPPPHQHLVVVVFLMIASLTGLKWYLSVDLICIYFIARDGEHFFMCFSAIWTSSFEKFCLVQFPTSLLVHWFFGEFSF
jgi:hypothetical protein